MAQITLDNAFLFSTKTMTYHFFAKRLKIIVDVPAKGTYLPTIETTKRKAETTKAIQTQVTSR